MEEKNKFLYQRISKSGVKFFLEKNNTFPVVSMGVFVRSGSRYENPDKLGISHFLEHAVFKGTKNRTAFEISHEIEKLGGELNAFTSPEYTLFYVKLLNKHIKKGFDVLSDIVKNAVFKEELIEREKRVILEEIEEYYDNPEDICQTEALRSIWGDQSVGNNPLGTKESVSKIGSKDLKLLYDKLFNKNNMLVSVAGDMDESSAENLIEHYFGDAKAEGTVPEVKKPEYRFNDRKFDKKTTQFHIAVTLKGFPLYTRESLMQSVYTTILGGNMSSRLFQRLREESALVYTIYAYPVRFIDTGGTVIYASTSAEYVSKVRSGIEKEINDIAKHGVKEGEFSDAKEYILGNVILGLETFSGRMQRNGVQSLFLGKVKKIEALIKEIESLSFDEFDVFARELSRSPRGSVLVGDINGR
ncbi:MAG: insulinase family protein [Caldisericaceae bacterium]|nr:insulinase family protein [Caldisericaceae bacterium]